MQLQTDVAGERAVEGEHRRTRRRQAALTALLLGVAGVGYRVVLLAAGVPPANSDEATMGLAALHISQGRELPVYFYGQHYMGTLEAYLAAPVVALAGPDIWALRLPLLMLYAVFLLAMWQLTRRLYTPWFATAIVGLLAFGSHRVIQNQFVAGGGYPEINPGAALLLLIAVVLGFRGAAARHAYGLYLAFGFIAGLLIWNDWLVAPYVAVAALLLLLPGVRPLLGRPGLALLGGLLLGIAPLLWHDLTQPVGNGAIATFLNMSDGAAETGWAQRLHGGVLLGVPLAQGFCGYGRCEPWQIAWAPIWGLLLIAATVAAARGLWRRRAAAGPPLAQADPTLAQANPPLPQAGPERTAAQDRERTRQAGRLALLVAAAITVLMYVRDDAAAVTPWESARYLHGLLIATAGGLLAALVGGAPGRRPAGAGGRHRRARLRRRPGADRQRHRPDAAAGDQRDRRRSAAARHRTATGRHHRLLQRLLDLQPGHLSRRGTGALRRSRRAAASRLRPLRRLCAAGGGGAGADVRLRHRLTGRRRAGAVVRRRRHPGGDHHDGRLHPLPAAAPGAPASLSAAGSHRPRRGRPRSAGPLGGPAGQQAARPDRADRLGGARPRRAGCGWRRGCPVAADRSISALGKSVRMPSPAR